MKMTRKSNLCFLPILMSVLVLVFISSGCTAKPENIVAEPTLTEELPMVAEEIGPTETFTQEPTQEPSPIPTEVPTEIPTETPVPELGLIENGIEFWSIPIDSGAVTINTIGLPDDYLESKIGYIENDIMNVQVPANYVVAEVHFNQVLPNGTKLQLLETGAVTPWYERLFAVDANDNNAGVLLMDHQYIINPPFWEITYHARIVDASGKVYWEKDLRIFKALPNTCWDGSLPDPVTLYCKNFDGDWNYRDFPNFNPNADKFTSGEWDISDDYRP
jgi:hypothetical protein